MLETAVEAISGGMIVGVPTDTVYGLAIDPFDDDAVRRLFEAKGRPEGKPIGLLVSTVEQAETVGEISGAAHDLIRDYWPGALTIIVTPKVILSNWVGDTQRRTVGIRIPDHPMARALIDRTGPLAVTSANRSDEPEARDDREAREIFGSEVAVYLEGSCPGGVASTVVDATGGELKVLRDGAISFPGGPSSR